MPPDIKPVLIKFTQQKYSCQVKRVHIKRMGLQVSLRNGAGTPSDDTQIRYLNHFRIDVVAFWTVADTGARRAFTQRQSGGNARTLAAGSKDIPLGWENCLVGMMFVSRDAWRLFLREDAQ